MVLINVDIHTGHIPSHGCKPHYNSTNQGTTPPPPPPPPNKIGPDPYLSGEERGGGDAKLHSSEGLPKGSLVESMSVFPLGTPLSILLRGEGLSVLELDDAMSVLESRHKLW